MPLKELEVKYASKRQRAYKLSDGGGLHLLVQPSGSKLWRMKYRFDGKEKLLSFGKYPVVTLAIARKKRSEAKALLDAGTDPAPVKKAGKKLPVSPVLFEPIATSNVFLKGHRIRVEVTSSNFPKFFRNLNTGGDNITETKSVVAKNGVHYSAGKPSYIELPVIRRK